MHESHIILAALDRAMKPHVRVSKTLNLSTATVWKLQLICFWEKKEEEKERKKQKKENLNGNSLSFANGEIISTRMLNPCHLFFKS